MIDANPTDPGLKRQGARQFFYAYFYAMYLKDQTSVIDAIEEYLLMREELDPNGSLLLTEIKELIESNMSEAELKHLIEQTWRADSDSTFFGFTYKDVLNQIVIYLTKRSSAN